MNEDRPLSSWLWHVSVQATGTLIAAGVVYLVTLAAGVSNFNAVLFFLTLSLIIVSGAFLLVQVVRLIALRRSSKRFEREHEIAMEKASAKSEAMSRDAEEARRRLRELDEREAKRRRPEP